MEDKDIVRLYLERAEDAIGKTEEKYGAYCFRIAKNILGNDEDAKECVNDAYFAVWNRIPPEEPTSFSSFIGRITRNIALNRFDYNTAACRNASADLALEELSEILFDPRHEDAWVGGDFMRALNAFLHREKKRSRVIFVRRYFFCDSVSDIAKRVALQEGAVRSILFRTRKRLAVYLRKEGLGGIYVEEK